jgi:hypothetical protein
MPNTTASVQDSESFMNKLVAVGISNIAYLHGFFTKSVYVDSQIEGVSLNVLRDNGKSPTEAKLVAWLRSAFESLDKKYVSHYGFFVL